METIKVIGADIGNDALKIAMPIKKEVDGKEIDDVFTCEVMNVVSAGYNRRIFGMEKGHLSNLLDINIKIKSKDKNGEKVDDLGRYFVGGIAYKEAKGDIMERTSEDVKAENEDSIILLVTGIAYALYDENNPVKVENVALGSLLPTEEFFEETKDLVQIFEDSILNKTAVVKFNSTAFKGAEITINFVDMTVTPEGAAAQLSYAFNVDGTEKPIMKTMKHEIHLGVVIGSITTELCVFEQGEFNSRGFIGIPVGTANPLDNILSDLKSHGLAGMTRHQLDFIIRNNKKLIINDVNSEGGTKDLTEELNKYRQARFRYFTKFLVNKIYQRLSENGINTTLFHSVNLGGGGAMLTLDSFIKEFRKGNSKLIENARFANAIGALISIVQKRMEDSAAERDVFEEIATTD